MTLSYNGQRFYCMQADVKPEKMFNGRTIRVGMELYELDTWKTYIWSSTGWVQFSLPMTTST